MWYADLIKKQYSPEDWKIAQDRYNAYCKEIIKEGYKGDFIKSFDHALSLYTSTWWKDFFRGLKKIPGA